MKASSGRSAHTDHQTDPVHKVVCRERQIERREGVCADSPCNEKNVGQNIAGKSDHAEDV